MTFFPIFFRECLTCSGKILIVQNFEKVCLRFRCNDKQVNPVRVIICLKASGLAIIQLPMSLYAKLTAVEYVTSILILERIYIYVLIFAKICSNLLKSKRSLPK